MTSRPLGAVHLVLDLDLVDAAPGASDRVRRLLEAGLPSLQWRAKGRTTAERIRRGAPFAELAWSSGARFVVNGDVDAALAMGADGVHLPADGPDVAAVRERLPEGGLVGRSCHDARELVAAAGCDWVFVSPVFATPSKPDGRALGVAGFAALQARAPAPAYALGGIDPSRVAACLEAGAAGVAAIRALLDPRGEEMVALALAWVRRRDANG